MAARLLIFEDGGSEDLKPLTWTRPAWDLRCGIVTLAEKTAAAYAGAEVLYHARPHLADVLQEDGGRPILARAAEARSALAGPLLLVSGRILADAGLAARIPLDGPPEIFRSGDTVVAARLADGAAAAAAMAGEVLDAGALPELAVREVDVPLIRWPWDLVGANAREIEADFHRLARPGKIEGAVHPSAVIENPENVYVAADAVVQPGAVLLAGSGPIFIGAGAVVMAGAVIEGPASIGPQSRIKPRAYIGEGTTVGPVCKVGGEVEQSIIQALTNKQHDGFLGHSYLGAWCNLGAGTTTSDLKNNYSTVRVSVDGREVDTGRLFAGLVMGDHSKSAIGTMFNTGTAVGVGANIFGGEFPPKDIPSFVWGGARGLAEHDFDKFCQTAERIMARRQKALTPAQRAMLEFVFHQTRALRRAVTG